MKKHYVFLAVLIISAICYSQTTIATIDRINSINSTEAATVLTLPQ